MGLKHRTLENLARWKTEQIQQGFSFKIEDVQPKVAQPRPEVKSADAVNTFDVVPLKKATLT